MGYIIFYKKIPGFTVKKAVKPGFLSYRSPSTAAISAGKVAL